MSDFTCIECLEAQGQYHFADGCACEACFDRRIANRILDLHNSGHCHIVNPDGRIFTEVVPRIRQELLREFALSTTPGDESGD